MHVKIKTKEDGQKPFTSCANVFFAVMKEMTTSVGEWELCKPGVLDSKSYQHVQGLSLKIMKTVQKKKKVITAKQNGSEQKEGSRFAEKRGEMHQNLKSLKKRPRNYVPDLNCEMCH